MSEKSIYLIDAFTHDMVINLTKTIPSDVYCLTKIKIIVMKIFLSLRKSCFIEKRFKIINDYIFYYIHWTHSVRSKIKD